MLTITRKNSIRILALTAFLFLAYAGYYGWQVVAIGAAYKAKVLCSSIFVSGRTPQDVMRKDLAGVLSKINAEIDLQTGTVTTKFAGVPEQRAVFRDRLGCTLLLDAADVAASGTTGEASHNSLNSPARPRQDTGFKRPGRVPAEVSQHKLARALDDAFMEQDPDNPVRTRAVVVVYDGQIIAEHYAQGISADTPLPGWSMTKSVINALVGILVKQGKLSIDRPAPITEWSAPGDPRQAITLDHLLRMSSGLAFDERSGPVVSDVNRMLLRSRDTAAYALAKPLRHTPGNRWHYSSGTTNIIARIIRDSVGGGVADYHAFPRRTLFNKLGMTSAVMEVDAAGNFVGSSFMYATARDWARFGQLYLQDGVWEGERILPSKWVAYSTTPSPAAPLGKYGAHFWTNGGIGATGTAKPLKRLPADTFYAVGYEGQYVVIIPSRKLVVVRLGLTKKIKSWDMESFITNVLAAISISESF